MSVFSKIACCINLSEDPDTIAQYTRDIVRQNEAELILIHVAASSEQVLNRASSKGMIEEILENSRKSNEDQFKAYAEKQFGDLSPTIVFMTGKAEKEVLRVIDEYCADLVIIGSVSTKGFFGSLFNKPSEQIIGQTRVPVMVIPNDLSLECQPHF